MKKVCAEREKEREDEKGEEGIEKEKKTPR